MRGNFLFRVDNGKAALWNPMDGTTKEVFVYAHKDGITEIPLELAAWQSLFVVLEPNTNESPVFTEITSNRPIQKEDKPKLQITKAVRGKIFNPDPKHNTDITSDLQALVKDNVLSVDQLSGEGKLAIMHYKINDEAMYYMRWAEEGIHLAAGDAEAIALQAEIKQNDGKLSLITCEPGDYSLSKKDGESLKLSIPAYQNELMLASPWKVSFQKNRGVEKEFITLDTLMNLSEHTDFNIRHFSGTLSYETSINVSKGFLKNQAGIQMTFENIANIASVEVNGTYCGIVWAKPYAVEVGQALRQGENKVVIKVANSWSNRLIGDEYYPIELEQNAEGATVGSIPAWVREGKVENRPEKQRVAFTINRFYTKDDPLPPSGLFGKVALKKWVAKSLD